jgi:ribosomal protein S18 acetylase RimI-like enzyme
MSNDGAAKWRIRVGTHDDLPVIQRMLYEAASWDPDRPRRPFDEMLGDPHIARYIHDWGRQSDTAMIAETAHSEPIGAAWYRLFNPAEPGYGYIDASIPELTIGVTPQYRGQGVGTELIAALLNVAHDEGFSAMSLSVEFTNPAVALYERHGFLKVGTNGGAWTMRTDIRQLGSFVKRHPVVDMSMARRERWW